MSTISSISPMYETAGSAAKTNLASKRNSTTNCPPENPNCGQVQFRGDEFEKARKQKRNSALLTTVGVLGLGAAAMFGLGRLHNSSWVANLKNGWFKNGMETVTRVCNNGSNYVTTKSTQAWNWVKNVVTTKATQAWNWIKNVFPKKP